ncbi:GGDEF domain-containing protein [Pseudidiomarina sp. 1APP75-27a]|uniref:sensor domain-containing protein n=1 Tax=Pseudidiomarina terrestris TaxID=2820060 RepID=UPI002B058453|nr:GGDEF domain-containing protein [Pseudidiomarina sp. 1APP75-27a]MEA3586773.1 GGDEF domain-containing protein [Pseudidiomarina sp. 1APP75-27a]
MSHHKIEIFETLGQYMDLLMDAICVVDPEGHFVYISAGGERVFGYPPQEMMGRSMYDFIHPDDHAKTRATAAEIMAGSGKVDFENRYIRKNGECAFILWSARYSESDNIRIAVARDVTAQRKIEAEREALLTQLQQLALYDGLTGLPNRSLFYARAKQALAESKNVAVAYIDLDKFKEVNDEFGHAIGDRVIRAAAKRLQQKVRSGDTLARIGGDEFVVLFERVQNPNDALAIATKLFDAFEAPIHLPEGNFNIDASIGIALAERHGDQLEELLLHADDAMYRAKRLAVRQVVMASVEEQ